MKYLKTYLPVVFLIVYWCLFYFLEHNWNDNYAIYLVAILSLFTMIICAIKNAETFLQGLIMLIIYNVLSGVFLHIFSPSNGNSFLTGFSYTIMFFVFLGTSIIYLIIMSVRALSQDKKQG